MVKQQFDNGALKQNDAVIVEILLVESRCLSDKWKTMTNHIIIE